MAVTEEGCNRGVLFGLKRAWPPSVGCGHGRIEAEKETGATTEEETSTGSFVERAATGGWEEESIEEEKRKCFNLFMALIPSWE